MPVCACTSRRSSGAQTGTASAVVRLLADRGRRQRSARRTPRAKRSFHGSGQDLRRDGQCAGRRQRHRQPSRFSIAQLGLSGNATARDAGMLAYIGINGACAPGSRLRPPQSPTPIPTTLYFGQDAHGVGSSQGRDRERRRMSTASRLSGAAPAWTDSQHRRNIRLYGAPTGFTYCGNGANDSGPGLRHSDIGAAAHRGWSGITVNPDAYTSNLATTVIIKSPGVLLNDSDAAGYPLTVSGATASTPLTIALSGGGSVSLGSDGGFTATVPAPRHVHFHATKRRTHRAQRARRGDRDSDLPDGERYPGHAGGWQNESRRSTRRIIAGSSKKTGLSTRDPNCTGNPAPAGCPGSPALESFQPTARTSTPVTCQ